MGRPRLVPVLALAAAVIAVAVVVLGSGGGPTGMRATASFEAVNGLIPGAEVRAGGVAVGRVQDVTLGRGDVPQVTMRFERDYRLHAGATADIRLASQAGQLNRYIEVTRGDGAALPDGVHLGRASTSQPVELDDALSTLTPPVRADVKHLAAALDRTLQGRGDDLAAVLRHSGRRLRDINALVGALADEGPALRRLVSAGAALSGRLAREPDALGGTADELAGTLATTARREQQLGATVDRLPGALRSGTEALRAVRGTLPTVRRLTRSARPAARAARRAAPVMSRTLIAAEPALESAGRLVDETPRRLTTLRPLVRQATPVVAQLPGVLKQFAPVLDQLRARAPDALGWLPLLGDATGSYDANGHAANLLVVLSPAPQNTIGPDSNAPGKLEAPFDRTPGVLGGDPWRDWRDSLVGDKPAGAAK